MLLHYSFACPNTIILLELEILQLTPQLPDPQPAPPWHPGCARRQRALQQPRAYAGAKQTQHTGQQGQHIYTEYQSYNLGNNGQQPHPPSHREAPGLHPPARSWWPKSASGAGERGTWTWLPLRWPLQWDKPAPGSSDPDHNHVAACAAHLRVRGVMQSHYRDQWEELPGE